MAFPAAGDASDYDYETWAVTGLLGSSKNSELKDQVKISENSGEDTEGFQNDAAFSAEQFERAEVSMWVPSIGPSYRIFAAKLQNGVCSGQYNFLPAECFRVEIISWVILTCKHKGARRDADSIWFP